MSTASASNGTECYSHMLVRRSHGTGRLRCDAYGWHYTVQPCREQDCRMPRPRRHGGGGAHGPPQGVERPPHMLGKHTAKPRVGESTMNADALPPDIDPDSRSRLPLPNRDDLDEAGQQTFDLLSDPHGGSLAGLRGPGGLRLHSPRVSAGLRPVNTYLRYAAGIEPRLRELVILVTVREHDCQFAWTAHEDEARREGLSAEVIDIIRHRRPTDGLAEADSALIDFGRELFGTHRVTPQTYARVAVLFERRMLVDVVNLMGMYAATAVMLIAFDAQLPEGVDPGLPPR